MALSKQQVPEETLKRLEGPADASCPSSSTFLIQEPDELCQRGTSGSLISSALRMQHQAKTFSSTPSFRHLEIFYHIALLTSSGLMFRAIHRQTGRHRQRKVRLRLALPLVKEDEIVKRLFQHVSFFRF